MPGLVCRRRVFFRMLNHPIRAALAFVLFTVPCLAQSPTSTPTLSVAPDVLTRGSSVSVSYSNPKLAGQTVTIDVDNGMRRDTERESIVIELDENGCGTVMWSVPSWFGANFNAPDVGEVHCPIV